VVKNTEMVLAIELMNACQALELRRPKQSSPAIEQIMSAYRQVVPFLEQDRIIHDDMVKTVQFMNDYALSTN